MCIHTANLSAVARLQQLVVFVTIHIDAVVNEINKKKTFPLYSWYHKNVIAEKLRDTWRMFKNKQILKKHCWVNQSILIYFWYNYTLEVHTLFNWISFNNYLNLFYFLVYVFACFTFENILVYNLFHSSLNQ